MTIRPSDPDYWYYPDAESLPAEFGGKERPSQAAPVSEGMETTAEERAHWLSVYAGKTFNELPMLLRTLRDLDRALAEIARLTAINADLCAVNLRHAEAIARLAAEQPPVPPDRERHRVTRAAVLAEREACETVVAKILSDSPPIDRILSAIRARPTP